MLFVMRSVFVLRNWIIKSTSHVLANDFQVLNEVRAVIFKKKGKLCEGPYWANFAVSAFPIVHKKTACLISKVLVFYAPKELKPPYNEADVTGEGGG